MPNRMRWDGKSKRFYEVWYAIFVEPDRRTGYWIRYTLLNPGDSHPEAGPALWFGYSDPTDPSKNFILKRQLAMSDFQGKPGRFDLTLGDAELREGVLRGKIEQEGHRVAWDIAYSASGEPHYFFGPLARRILEKRTSVTIPNPQIELRGRVTVDGEAVTSARFIGHQAHHWGRKRARGWTWAHGCAFEAAKEAILEVLAADIGIGRRLVLLRVQAPSGTYDFTRVPLAPMGKASYGRGTWSFEAHDLTRKAEVEIRVDPKAVVRAVYHSPDYEISHCWNTQVADAEVKLYRRASPFSEWREAETLTARGNVAAEVVVPVVEDTLYGANASAAPRAA